MSRSLFRSTSVVSGMTSLSRVLGFARDVVLAQFFGAGAGTDAFFVAFRIPNFLRRLFAEGSFSQAFIPVFAEAQTREDPAELKRLVDQVAGTLAGMLFLITLAGVVAAPILIYMFAPGFAADAGKHALAAEMLRITFPYLLFISLTAMAGGILNSCGRFAVPAVTPALLNLCLIGAALWAAPHFDPPVLALAWGVFAAGVAQLLFQLPYLKALNLLPRPRWGWGSSGVRRVLRLMIPTLFGSSVAQVNLLFDTLLASFLVTGSVSWLYYSDRLVEFPLGVFGVALGVVILPTLSRKHASAAAEEFSQTLDWAIRWSLLVGLPATVALAMLSGPLLTALFQYGEFRPEDVRMASRSLAAYSLGLVAFMLVKVLAPAFYSRQDPRTPVKIGVVAMVANMGMNLALILPLAHAGLALATSLSACLNAGLLLRRLRIDGIYRPAAGWCTFLLRLAAANGAMAAVLWVSAGPLAGWIEAGAGARWSHLAWLVPLGAGTYAIVALALGVRPPRVGLDRHM